MANYELEYYGVPLNYKEHFESVCKTPQLIEKYTQIIHEQMRPTELIQKYVHEGYLGYLLVIAAIENNLSFLIPIVYALSISDRKRVYCDWIIEHPEIDLTASNAFFISYFNELYLDKPDLLGRSLSSRGIALRALAYISYIPWINFRLPVTDTMMMHFLNLPLYHRENNFYPDSSSAA